MGGVVSRWSLVVRAFTNDRRFDELKEGLFSAEAGLQRIPRRVSTFNYEYGLQTTND